MTFDQPFSRRVAIGPPENPRPHAKSEFGTKANGVQIKFFLACPVFSTLGLPF